MKKKYRNKWVAPYIFAVAGGAVCSAAVAVSLVNGQVVIGVIGLIGAVTCAALMGDIAVYKAQEHARIEFCKFIDKIIDEKEKEQNKPFNEFKGCENERADNQGG